MPYRQKRAGKPTGKWVGKVIVDGGLVWCGVHDTKMAARVAEDAERAKSRRPGRRRVTCRDFALAWTASYPRPRDTTNAHNHERVSKFADEFGKVALRDVDRPLARRWALENPARLSAVRAMFTDAMNDGIIDHNPFTGLRLPGSKGRKDITVLTERELHKLAECAPRAFEGDYGHELRALLLFAAEIGCRPSELIAIDVEDVDTRLGEVRIEWQVERNGRRVRPKNGKARKAALTAPALDAVKPYLARPLAEPVWRNQRGDPYLYGALMYSWNKVRCLYGDAGLDFYEVTRHYAATRLLEAGIAPHEVAVQLGHTDGGRLVMSTYGHPSEDLARANIRAAREHAFAVVSLDARRNSVVGRQS